MDPEGDPADKEETGEEGNLENIEVVHLEKEEDEPIGIQLVSYTSPDGK